MEFTKPFRTIQQQIDLLTDRGLIIDDSAAHYLQHLNYYRLSGYWLPFYKEDNTNLFKKDTKFSDILNLYIFDRELRLLLLDGIERIEISIRTQWAYYFSQYHGPHAFMDCNLSNNSFWHAQNLITLEKELKRSDELFIDHFKKNNITPPIWAMCEVMSFGLLSRWLKCMKSTQSRNKISEAYSIDYDVLVSFIEHLSYLRNLCAHHSRVWNKKMTKTMKIPQSKPSNLVENFNRDTRVIRKIYNTLVLMVYTLDLISPNNHFKSRLINLLDAHKIEPVFMGFPLDWKNRVIWKD
ncbi:TPA: Abi family protein [Legionella pneumophila]|nr:Abi family protein [Legionella pneumophila]HAT1860640.1 Abi family protein [Legionella pneumophila]HAT1924558.1 Abi family protein [Legionella pneumophila]HAT7770437.1 Abi family protein [Legionella pneumophila]HAU1639637.1 Abi family protein [Legionella pneumophila]